MFKNFHVELIPKATRNGYRNMQNVILEREYVSVICKVYAVQQPFVSEQNVIVSIIIHILTVLSYLCCTGKARRAKEAGISFISP
jgi:hypothetical protein